MDYISVADEAPQPASASPTAALEDYDVRMRRHNYLLNPGFETGSIAPWAVWSDNGSLRASYVEPSTVLPSNGGGYHANEWASGPYSIDIYQAPINLPSGTYTLSAWVESGRGQTTCVMYVRNYGGNEIDLPINSFANGTGYTLLTIPNIKVTNGQCECGFYTIDSGDHAMKFDDVMLTKQ